MQLSAFSSVSKIYLYGSCAAGCNTPESDIDLAVFLESGCAPDVDVFKALHRLIAPMEEDIQLQIFSEDELPDPCGIVGEIVSFGILWYDRKAAETNSLKNL